MHWLWLLTAVVILTLGPAWGRLAGAVGCAGWNTEEFFETAAPEQVRACLAAGADLKARDRLGKTPLHEAAGSTTNPAVLTALLAAGADLKAQDEDGQLPWDVAQDNTALKGTEVLQRLNAGRSNAPSHQASPSSP